MPSFTVYIIEHVNPEQFIVQIAYEVVAGTLIPNGVELTFASGATQTYTSRNPITVTRAWDALIPSTPTP